MAQRWYQSRHVQAAMVGGIFLLAATAATIFSHFCSQGGQAPPNQQVMQRSPGGVQVGRDFNVTIVVGELRSIMDNAQMSRG